jgi:hypothetical protein
MKVKLFKWLIKDFFVRKRQKDWIMCRVACLGKDVIKLLDLDYLLVNIQKGRIDNDESNSRLNIQKIIPHIKRHDIQKIIYEQKIRYKFLNNAPKVVFIDSYSELTDQCFNNFSNNYKFYANYSDISHSSKFKLEFESLGLCDLNEIEMYYIEWIKNITGKYGNSIPIIYFHFVLIKLRTLFDNNLSSHMVVSAQKT